MSDEWQDLAPMEPDPDLDFSEDSPWGTDAAPVENEESQEIVSFKSFDPKWRDKFLGLTYLGRLEGTVEIPYHSFDVRTLTSGEKIKVTELVQPLEQSIGYARAYRAVVVAAGLMRVDGKPLLISETRTDAIAQRYRYITDNWHDPVIDIVYDKINDLEGEVLEILKELGIYQARREVVQVSEAETA